MKTLYISDMDGTLLNNDGLVSKKSAEIINELIKKGLLFSVATARSAMTAAELLKDIDISVPAVLMNGVFLFDLKTGKAVKYHEIPGFAFYEIVKIVSEYDKAPFLFFYGDDDTLNIDFTELKLQIHRDFYDSRVGKFNGKFKKVPKLELKPGLHPVFFSLSDKYEELKPVYDNIIKIDGVTASFYADTYTPYWFLEIYNENASKANGAKEAAEFVGADTIAAFGDNRNDLLLFSGAEKKYAVENAVPELKANADIIIGSNENDGVAVFLAEDFKG